MAISSAITLLPLDAPRSQPLMCRLFCAVTPNYSVVGEAPLRISDFYGVGDGSLEGGRRLRRNLRFLVVLREPVARTISSWEYKSDRECLLHLCPVKKILVGRRDWFSVGAASRTF